VVAHADVTRGEDVERLIADCGHARAPLRGVVHAAGCFDDSLVLNHDWARFERVLAPKVLGAWHLHRLTRELGLEQFLLVSSAASVVGMPGLSNYAAANAFLDALAEHRRALGLPGLSVGFSAWSAIGMAGAVDDLQRRRWSMPASGPLQPEEALAALEALLSGDRAHVGVIAADWAAVAAKLGTTPAWLRGLDSESAAGAGPEARGTADALAGLSELAPEERRRRLVAYVRDLAASVLGLGPGELLDAGRPLHEAGLDSLGALELRNRLQHATGLDLAPTLAFDLPTIDALAGHLASGVAPSPPIASRPATGARIERLLGELEQLTDADAVLALGREERG
jgi:acyl carrier protein